MEIFLINDCFCYSLTKSPSALSDLQSAAKGNEKKEGKLLFQVLVGIRPGTSRVAAKYLKLF